MTTESAIDLSVKSRSSSESDTDCKTDTSNNISIVRPIPRPPWSIIWYQNLWPSYGNSSNAHQQQVPSPSPSRRQENNSTLEHTTPKDEYCNSECNYRNQSSSKKLIWRKCDTGTISSPIKKKYGSCLSQRPQDCQFTARGIENCDGNNKAAAATTIENGSGQMAAIIDVACCDGPVRFERISNPNFALTVEHQDEPSSSTTASKTSGLIGDDNNEPDCRNSAMTKTYVCIYCNQSFKSLFCYQKHKKRHLNPVSVDITGTNVNTSAMVCTYHFAPENRAKTKDLNVQFFPCKKCGCKFPSYYFVHKHKKTCH